MICLYEFQKIIYKDGSKDKGWGSSRVSMLGWRLEPIMVSLQGFFRPIHHYLCEWCFHIIFPGIVPLLQWGCLVSSQFETLLIVQQSYTCWRTWNPKIKQQQLLQNLNFCHLLPPKKHLFTKVTFSQMFSNQKTSCQSSSKRALEP